MSTLYSIITEMQMNKLLILALYYAVGTFYPSLSYSDHFSPFTPTGKQKTSVIFSLFLIKH